MKKGSYYYYEDNSKFVVFLWAIKGIIVLIGCAVIFLVALIGGLFIPNLHKRGKNAVTSLLKLPSRIRKL
jgi:hypothetical protein